MIDLTEYDLSVILVYIIKTIMKLIYNIMKIYDNINHRSNLMYIRFLLLNIILASLIVLAGCHILLTEQEWSENYALLDGTQSTNPEMIDGNYNTIGETRSSTTGPGRLYGSSNATEVIVTLPEKRMVRRIVVHSENIKKFAIYADKGRTLHSETDWQLLEEVKMVKSNPIEIPLLQTYPIDSIRLVVLDTFDGASLNRRAKAEFMAEADEYDRNPENRNNRNRNRQFNMRRYPAKISEIEFFGYKSATKTTAIKSDPKQDVELDEILE